MNVWGGDVVDRSNDKEARKMFRKNMGSGTLFPVRHLNSLFFGVKL